MNEETISPLRTKWRSTEAVLTWKQNEDSTTDMVRHIAMDVVSMQTTNERLGFVCSKYITLGVKKFYDDNHFSYKTYYASIAWKFRTRPRCINHNWNINCTWEILAIDFI